MLWMNSLSAVLLLGATTSACAGETGPSGPAGPPGSEGPPGPAGPAGTAGTVVDGGSADPSKIVRSIGCSGTLEGTVLFFSYDVALAANGTIYASASVRDPSLGASGAIVYSPAQNGATNAAVIVPLDELPPANGGYFRITLNRETLVTSIVYTDVDATGGSRAWTMQPTQCVSNAY